MSRIGPDYCKIQIIFLKHCHKNVSFMKPYVVYIKMKTWNPIKFSQLIDNVFLTVIRNKFIV